ncbi:MAG: peptidyl-prolyl cis-trans isomerase [Gemmatimonadota bacterium]|nr:MAG: peptidyl-prolyl cis-trans isomerase [Gemmatimonadota bacterium]
MMGRILVGALIVCLSGCGDLFNRNVVARAGADELTVEWLAQTLAESNVPPQPTVVERWSWLWIQYALYLQRLAAGDSLIDTTTVLEAMWPEVLIGTVENYYDRLVAERVTVGERQVDSAYAAGNHILIDHILVAADAQLTPEENQRRRRLAEAIHARLAAGGDWDREAQNSDDPATRHLNGRLGLVTPGEMAPQFEQAAYELDPGEISGVVDTRFGYHILRRPALEDVREEFAGRIAEVLVERWKTEYVEELSIQRALHVLDEGPEIIREAAERPIRVLALEPRRVIGTYDGGVLTDVTFVGWLQAWPAWEHMGIEGAGDEELKEQARMAMQNEILFLEAKSVGTRLRAEQFSRIKGQLSRRLSLLRRAMRVDTVMARAAPEDRNKVARQVLDEYVSRIITGGGTMQTVPPFLARKLRAESDWRFSYAGVNRAIRLAVELQTRAEQRIGATGTRP